MPTYGYQAYDDRGTMVSGVLTADTPAAGRRSLSNKGLRLLDFALVESKGGRRLRLIGARRRRELVAEFARQLSMLIRAGVSLTDGLGVLLKQKQGEFTNALREVRERVSAGIPFSDALEGQPAWFNNVFCEAVRVGQRSGSMERALLEVAEYMRGREAIRTRIFAAMAYPAILSVLGLGVVHFLMTYVVPQLLTVLESTGGSLPQTTLFLKGLSDALVGHWVFILAVVASGMLVVWSALHWEPIRLRLLAMQLKLPVIGSLMQKAVVTQFAQTMSILLRSGVTFLEAVRALRSTSGNLVLAKELAAVEQAVERGGDIAASLKDSLIFPPLAVHVINVGQNAGELTEVLTQLKEGYEKEVDLAIGRATAVLEPLLIVILSVIIGFIVFATMMPILEVTRTIH